MKKLITLFALIATLAILSTGCSELNSPTAPETVSTIDFPQEGNGGGDDLAEAVAPSGLEAKKVGSSVELAWRHSAMGEHWYRVYRNEDGSRFDLIQTTQGCEFTDLPAAGFDKLVYRVTAVNAQGVESPFSNSAAAYGDDKDAPNQEIGQDDMDDWN
jgi:hypothetical protein